MTTPAGSEPRSSAVEPHSAPSDEETKADSIPVITETSAREVGCVNDHIVSAPAGNPHGYRKPAETSTVPDGDVSRSGEGTRRLIPDDGGSKPDSISSAVSRDCRELPKAASPVLRDHKGLNRGCSDTPDQTLGVARESPTSPSVEPPVVFIKDLKPARPTPWAVIALVFARNPVRAWKNLQDGGTLLELYVMDSPALCIRATLFNQAVDKFSAIAVPGTTCFFSGGRVRRAFAAGESNIEISFGKESDIRVASAPLTVVPAIPCQPLARLSSLPERGTATAVLVVHGVGGLKRVLTRKGKAVDKRELLLVDDSNTSTVCTTWGQLAQSIGEILEGTILLVRRGLISDYNNTRSISISAGSEILQDPFLNRAEELRQWYSGLPPDHTFPVLSPNF